MGRATAKPTKVLAKAAIVNVAVMVGVGFRAMVLVYSFAD